MVGLDDIFGEIESLSGIKLGIPDNSEIKDVKYISNNYTTKLVVEYSYGNDDWVLAFDWTDLYCTLLVSTKGALSRDEIERILDIKKYIENRDLFEDL